MRTLALTLVAAILFPIAPARAAADPQRIGDIDISHWRGFNLLEKFTLRGNAPYVEDDFRWIAELGFNFVRLPMDYRCYTETDDWLKFKEPVLREIDQAIAFGEKHHIHVCVNLHRAPGFCINPPVEATNLWTDEKPLEAFVAHWVMFARRYKSIPSTRLSFNLLNEPARSTAEQYLKVFRRTIEAIQKEDPNRLIIVDGMNVGRDPVPEFLAYRNVIQATRGYHPGLISHYKASWVKGSDQWPEPTWPMFPIAGYLYGPAKPDLRGSLVIQGDLPAGTEIAHPAEPAVPAGQAGRQGRWPGGRRAGVRSRHRPARRTGSGSSRSGGGQSIRRPANSAALSSCRRRRRSSRWRTPRATGSSSVS